MCGQWSWVPAARWNLLGAFRHLSARPQPSPVSTGASGGGILVRLRVRASVFFGSGPGDSHTQPGLRRGDLEETTEKDKSRVQLNSANIAGTPGERHRARGRGVRNEGHRGPEWSCALTRVPLGFPSVKQGRRASVSIIVSFNKSHRRTACHSMV